MNTTESLNFMLYFFFKTTSYCFYRTQKQDPPIRPIGQHILYRVKHRVKYKKKEEKFILVCFQSTVCKHKLSVTNHQQPICVPQIEGCKGRSYSIQKTVCPSIVDFSELQVYNPGRASKFFKNNSNNSKLQYHLQQLVIFHEGGYKRPPCTKG